jgi:hypothetical protein
VRMLMNNTEIVDMAKRPIVVALVDQLTHGAWSVGGMA